jgi:hypothetical protein
MFTVAFTMRFGRRTPYLCENHRGERFIGPRWKAVKFATREDAQRAGDATHHRDIRLVHVMPIGPRETETRG